MCDIALSNFDWDLQGLREGDYIFSINKKNVLGQHQTVILQLLTEVQSSVEIGLVRPTTNDSNLCESSNPQ